MASNHFVLSSSREALFSPPAVPRRPDSNRKAVLSRKQSRPRLALASIAEETNTEASCSTSDSPIGHAQYNVRDPDLRTGSLWRNTSRRKTGLPTDPTLRELCGICFEVAVKPNRTRCCGQFFCYQHLSEWLGACSSDGRCPSCCAPLELDRDTLALHSPPKNAVSPKVALSSLRTSSARSVSLLNRDVQTRIVPSLGEPLISDTALTLPTRDLFNSGLTCDRSTKAVSQAAMRPQYETLAELLSAIVPVHSFGAVLSLLGFGLVIGTLLS